MKKLTSSIAVIVVLSYVLFKTEDTLTRIVVIPFLTFGLAYFLQGLFRVLRKEKLAAVMGKVYVIAFAVYWFGFLIAWDYISIVNRNYISALFSLIPWLGGGYIIYRKLKRKV